jgi:hypothetical protein
MDTPHDQWYDCCNCQAKFPTELRRDSHQKKCLAMVCSYCGTSMGRKWNMKRHEGTCKKKKESKLESLYLSYTILYVVLF